MCALTDHLRRVRGREVRPRRTVLVLALAATKLAGAAKDIGAAYADSLGKIDCS